MNESNLLNVLTLLTFGFCSCGFYKFIYFFSIGYGFAISGIGISLLVIFRNSLTLWTTLLCLLFIVYGCRLSGYLILREMKSSAYRNILKTDAKNEEPMYEKIFVWIGCALLYICMTAPVTFRLNNQTPDDITTALGFFIGCAGFLMEVLADYQKTQVKKKDPNMFACEGIYKFVRCPNYFGELVLWLGITISSITSINSATQWTIVILGYIGITYVMFSGARRIEVRQDRNYGKNPKYQKYKYSTPMIIPFVPIYSVIKYKWLVA